MEMDIPDIRYKQEEVVNLSLLDEISIFHTKEAYHIMLAVTTADTQLEEFYNSMTCVCRSWDNYSLCKEGIGNKGAFN
jgi:hypothetical protein